MKLARITGRIDRRSRGSAVDVDGALVVVAMLDPDLDSALKGARQSIGPFDGRYATLARQLLQAQIVDLDRLQPVEVHVIQPQAPAGVLLDEGEGRTGHLAGVD